jgi:hypothetical protein
MPPPHRGGVLRFPRGLAGEMRQRPTPAGSSQGAKMRRAPCEEFPPFLEGEGFMVAFLPTASIALPLNVVVGKADAQRLVGKPGSRK